MGWLLVLGLKESLVECATVFVKSEVILVCLGKSANVSRSSEVVNYLQFEAHKFTFYALFLRYKIDLR